MTNNLEVFGLICSPHLLQSEVERLQAKFPSLSPSPLPNLQDTDSQKGGGDLPFVGSMYGDME